MNPLCFLPFFQDNYDHYPIHFLLERNEPYFLNLILMKILYGKFPKFLNNYRVLFGTLFPKLKDEPNYINNPKTFIFLKKDSLFKSIYNFAFSSY